MADDSRDDADDEITRIVRRPGPAQLPINLMRPAGSPPSAGSDAVIPPPIGTAPANDSVPPVAPPNAFDRARPVMTPPPRPSGPPLGGVPLPPAPPVAGPAPVVIRPTPPVSAETRIAPMPASFAAPSPVSAPVVTPASTPGVMPAPIAEQPAPVAVQPAPAPAIAQPVPVAASIATPAPAPTPAPIVAEAPKPITRSTPIAPPIAAPVIAPAPAPTPVEPVVGWLVVIKGPGRGTAREIVTGRNPLGSASGQAIRLDFGDPAIAAQGHAYIVYDEEAREFFVEDGKQKIVVRLNGKLLTETMPIAHGDELRIGATSLRFVALCGPDFDWHEKEEKPAEAVSSDEPAGDEKSETGTVSEPLSEG